MIHKFARPLLAAALAASAVGALANPVLLNLDLLGETAKKNEAPVAVNSLQGFNFSSAFAYRADMLNPAVDLSVPAVDTTGSFLMNDDRTPDKDSDGNEIFTDLEISLGSGYRNAGQYFQSFKTSIFSTKAVKVTWYGSSTNPGSGFPTLPSGPIAWGEWAPDQTWSASDSVDRIVISATRDGYLGLRNISIGLTDATIPNPAPEPAGYALVGLALLAAGAATRRRA